MKKEMNLRFLMAYFIIFITIGCLLWWLTRFSADFGWDNSYAWLWASLVSWSIDMVALELIVTGVHFALIKAFAPVGNLITSIRQFKIADKAMTPDELTAVLEEIAAMKKAKKNKDHNSTEIRTVTDKDNPFGATPGLTKGPSEPGRASESRNSHRKSRTQSGRRNSNESRGKNESRARLNTGTSHNH